MAMNTDSRLGSALRGLAFGRIALGVVSLAAPRGTARLFGIRPTPELTYMTRIFGARAIALGLGYLGASETERVRLQRLALMVDVIDTVHGAAHLVRGDVARPIALSMVGLTGSYMAVGAARFALDLR
ncbi:MULTISPECIES: hypothetical protein [unclassified Nocardia]|uniref:hypothetical protein n=1 Tax=unclassified Nocardia TaxID=2637762 RepID=UPI001CE45BB9|nr:MULTISPECIES: hypothetical protein [unclassified Nocardia]